MKKYVFLLLFLTGLCAAADFTTNGMNGLGGAIYDHVIVAVGRNNNPLSGSSQVGVYSNIKGNEYATSHIAAFESSVGVDAGVTVQRMESYTVGNVDKGSGATIVRYKNYGFADDSPGTHNAIFAAHDDTTFTGNWFMHYAGARPSRLGGDLGLGRDPAAVSNSRSLVIDGSSNAFIRLYVNGAEKGRITVSGDDLRVDSLGTGGRIYFGNLNGSALIIGPNGEISIPALAGTGSRTVKADSTGTLSAP